MTRREHIEKLAEGFSVEWHNEGWGATIYSAPRFLLVPDRFPLVNQVTEAHHILQLKLPVPITDSAYAICLHELGHALGRTSSELEAWRWARRHALYWTDEMERAMDKGLSSYLSPQEFLEVKRELAA